MFKKAIILTASLLCIASFAYADKLYLKSGKAIEGEISQETEDYIKINFSGVELTYFKDQINKIARSGGPAFMVGLENPTPAAKQAFYARKSFIWKIDSGKGDLYLLGSLHVGKSELYPLPENITDAFEASDKVAVEADINNLSASLKMMEEGIYAGGQTINEKLKPSTLRLLEAKLSARSLNFSEYAVFKPWFLSLFLQIMELKKLGFDEELGIDRYFLDRAEGKEILELEGAEFQINLFNEFSESLQDMFLFSTLMGLDGLKIEIEQIVKAWISGDAAEMERITFKDKAKYPELSLMYEKLFYERNRNMASKIEVFLKQGGSFFVIVGAGHLVGERGIVKLLEQKGYAVRQL